MADRIALSIVVPVYNRERFVARAIQSCLAGSGDAVEVIAVDDGSTDGSMDEVAAITDPRLRICRQNANAGVCAARRRGVAEARGEWVAFVDSDDELLPDAVERVLEATRDCPEHVGALFFRRRHDYGTATPANVPKLGELGYGDYIALMDANMDGNRDVFLCARAATFAEVNWPTDRARPLEYHLDFARRYPMILFEDVLYLCHGDADNRVTGASAAAAPPKAADPARMVSLERILARHGDAIAAHGPVLADYLVTNLLSLTMIEGRRAEAWALLRFARRKRLPLMPKLAVFALGCLNRNLLQIARRQAKRIRSARQRGAGAEPAPSARG